MHSNIVSQMAHCFISRIISDMRAQKLKPYALCDMILFRMIFHVNKHRFKAEEIALIMESLLSVAIVVLQHDAVPFWFRQTGIRARLDPHFVAMNANFKVIFPAILVNS